MKCVCLFLPYVTPSVQEDRGEKELLELTALLGSKGLTMSTLGIIPVIVRKGGVGGSCFLQQFLDALTVLKREKVKNFYRCLNLKL